MTAIMNVAPPTPWWYSFLPLIIVGVVALGFIFLVVLGILISRRVTITVRTGGALALTLASILLLSGLWCMFLSPTMEYTQTKDSFYREISIDGLESWSYSIDIQEKDNLVVSVDGIRAYNGSGKAFNVYIYDPDGDVVWSEANTTYSHSTIKVLRSGVHRVEAQNPNQNAIECYVHVTVTAKVIYRVLEPLGQWLSLVSLPIFGLGMWASGVFAVMQKEYVRTR